VVFFFSAGTLIKLVYTASCGGGGAELRFAKFERRRMQECFDFVRAQGLVHRNGSAFFCAEFWLIL
jgi:type II pantothenate kinase